MFLSLEKLRLGNSTTDQGGAVNLTLLLISPLAIIPILLFFVFILTRFVSNSTGSASSAIELVNNFFAFIAISRSNY